MQDRAGNFAGKLPRSAGVPAFVAAIVIKGERGVRMSAPEIPPPPAPYPEDRAGRPGGCMKSDAGKR